MSDTKYQITKTVRFKLEPEFDSDAAKQNFILSADNLDRDTSGLTKEETRSIQQTLEEKEDLTLVIEKLTSIKDKVATLIFCSQSYGAAHHTIFNNFKISRGWLARYLKISFYDYLNQTNSNKSYYTLSKLPFLVPAFKATLSENASDNVPTEIQIGWFNRINVLISELEKVKIVKNGSADDNRHNKTAYPNIALILNDINKRNNLEFIKEFINQLQIVTLAKDEQTKVKKTNYETLIAQIKTDIADLEKELVAKLKHFLPYQSEGILVCSGSLNYYIVNKSKKELDSIKEKLQNSLNSLYSLDASFTEQYHLSAKNAIEVLSKQFNKDNETIKNEFGITENLPLSLTNTYLYLNYWRGQQRKALQEAVNAYIRDFVKLTKQLNYKKTESEKKEIWNKIASQKKVAINRIKQNLLYQFKDDGIIVNYIDLCKNIAYKNAQCEKEKNENKKQKLKNELADLQLQCDEYLAIDYEDKKNKINKDIYEGFQIVFDIVAKEYGKYNTQLTSIEKDEVFSQMIGYWCVIVEQDKRKFLYMIPRDGENSMGKAYNYITKPNSSLSKGNTTLYYFESLTFRALQKLCYKNYDNTFREKFKDIIPENEFDNNEINNAADNDKDKIRINIYIKVLQKLIEDGSDSVFLAYNGFEEILSTEYTSIEEFDAALNKICYAKKVAVADDIANTLKNDYNAIGFEITSQDLTFKLNFGKDISKPRYATKQWNLFWDDSNQTEHFPVRFNPEVKVFYRAPKPSRVFKYGEQSDIYNPKFKNRYLHEQFTLALTVTENAINPHVNYAFDKDSHKNANNNFVQEIDESIKNFNKSFNKNDIKFALGIDVGTDSLAFVAACDTDLKPLKFKVLQINNLSTSKSNDELCKRLASKGIEKTAKSFFIKDNPSYFLNVKQYHKTFTGLDMSEDVAQQQMENDIANYFTQKEVTAIDLTNAKVVNNQIVVNGDVSTHLKLKLLKAERQLAKLFQKDFKPENIDIYIETDEDGKSTIKSKNINPSEYIIGRKSNDKITDFNELYAYFNSDRKASTQHLKFVTDNYLNKRTDVNYCLCFDENQNIVFQREISKEEYECLSDKGKKDSLFAENEVIKIKKRIANCAKDTIINKDELNTIVEIPQNPHKPAIKDTVYFAVSRYNDFVNFQNAVINGEKVAPNEIALVKKINALEKEFTNFILTKVDDNYFIQTILCEKNDAQKYNEVLEEFYEVNYKIANRKEQVEDLKAKNTNFISSINDDSITFNYNALSILYTEESTKKYEKIVTIEQIKDELIDFKDHQRLELARVVEKINNYRKSLVANMVGVLMNLYEQCKNLFSEPNVKGLIAFEGLTDEKNHIDFAKFEGSITIPLRTAMLIKLQEQNLVPSFALINKLSDKEKFATKKLKESDVFNKGSDVKKYGALWFVQEANTSKCCPLCGKKPDFDNEDYPYENKPGIGHADNFKCFPKGDDPESDRCGFCTEKALFTNVDTSKIDPKLQSLTESELIELFSSLDCNDKLASYNIAKRAIWNI